MLVPLAIFSFVAGCCWFLMRRLLISKSASIPASTHVAKTPGVEKTGAAQGVADKSVEDLWSPWAKAFAAQIPESQESVDHFRHMLRSAGLYHPQAATRLNALRVFLLLAPLFFTGILLTVAEKQHTSIILATGITLAGVLSILPRMYVWSRARRRRLAIRHTLPDTLDMLGMCTSGGMALSPALAHVARQIPHAPELAEELLIMRRQMEVGSLSQALADFSDRVQLSEARHLSSVLTRGDRLGNRMAGTLRSQADRLRTTRRQVATREANKAPVKLVLPVIFCFAPAAIILLIAPAALELKDFISPTNEQSVLTGNESLSLRSITNRLDDLNQDISN